MCPGEGGRLKSQLARPSPSTVNRVQKHHAARKPPLFIQRTSTNNRTEGEQDRQDKQGEPPASSSPGMLD
jgi:hypothetical protein